MSDDWKDDKLKQMEDQAEEDIERCTHCGEPFFASEAHDCNNDEGTPGYAERKHEYQQEQQRREQEKQEER